MRARSILPIWRLEQFWEHTWGRRGRFRTPVIDVRPATVYDDLLREIFALPADWHRAGGCGPLPLRAMALYGQRRSLAHSAETGVGKSTLLLSHLSQHHTVFTQDDTGTADSLSKTQRSPLLKREAVEFVLGPTQVTLPRHTFQDQLQLVLIDGPHGYPFPELEYYFLYPKLDEDGLLILDDIHIPTIFRLFSFLREERMFDFLGVASTTAFFRRNSTPLFDPEGDGWLTQNYNTSRFPVRAFDRDFIRPGARLSRVMRRILSNP